MEQMGAAAPAVASAKRPSPHGLSRSPSREPPPQVKPLVPRVALTICWLQSGSKTRPICVEAPEDSVRPLPPGYGRPPVPRPPSEAKAAQTSAPKRGTKRKVKRFLVERPL